jgi:Ser/Thr protein kinase RdoA (MazF antagonist)
VRKPSGPWSPTVHALLQHLSAKGFPAPHPLGIDDRKREILSYIEGAASIWPWPEILGTQDGVRRVGAMLRRLHDAVIDFVPPAPCVWQDFESRAPLAGEIVCHGDFGPYNLIWQGTEIVGVIDWEWARPAPPIRDVAWAAWSFVPLRTDEDYARMRFSGTLETLKERLQALLNGYGWPNREDIVGATLALQQEFSEKIAARGRQGIEPWKTFFEIGLHKRNQRDKAWLEWNRDQLLR